MALHEAAEAMGDTTAPIKLNRLAALDHSDLCMQVMEFNFPSTASEKKRKRQIQYSIETLSLEQAHEWSADIWSMSPPCQPHTRQHENQSSDLSDARSKSFLHLCDLLSDMDESKLPKLILLENVVGFEHSGSFARWRTVMNSRNYKTASFHLTPTQVGLPNDRPRFYCVSSLYSCDGCNLLEPEDDKSNIRIHTSLSDLQVPPLDADLSLPPISTFMDNRTMQEQSHLLIPAKLINSKSSWCFDIVTPASQHSSCFTSSYGKFIKGTGSVLYTGKKGADKIVRQDPQDRVFDTTWKEGLDDPETCLRYFSASEIARLMGFHQDFTFPETVSLKQQWKLLGNSLNVRVASKVSELGLRTAFGRLFLRK